MTDETHPHKVVVGFETQEDAMAFCELVQTEWRYPAQYRDKRNRGNKPTSEQRCGILVLGFMQVGRSYHSSDVAAFLQEHKYSGASANATLSKLAHEKVLRALGDGHYQKIPDATPTV